MRNVKDGVEAGRFTMQSRDTYWVHQDALTELPTRHAELTLDDDALVIDGCDIAIMGTTHDGRAVYDYNRLVTHFSDEFSAGADPDADCEQMAIEWVDYNVTGALCAPESPVVMYLIKG